MIVEKESVKTYPVPEMKVGLKFKSGELIFTLSRIEEAHYYIKDEQGKEHPMDLVSFPKMFKFGVWKTL